jgi:diacylglycerol kinase family enzyme
MIRIGIIVNSRAKGVKKSRRDLAEVFAAMGGDMVDVRTTLSLAELDQVCRDFMTGGYAYVAIAGGDGTVHQVITRLIALYGGHELPRVVLLRSGTMENIARDLSLSGKGPRMLAALVAALARGGDVAVSFRDTIRVDGRYGFIFGTGLVTNILNAAYDCENPGPLRNLVVIAAAMRDGVLNRTDSRLFKRIRAAVRVDDHEIPFTDIAGILAATVEHKGMGFRLLPRANERSGTFQAIITGLRPLEIATQVLRAKKGVPLRGSLNFNDIGSRLVIAGREPLSYTIDGDLYESEGEIVVDMGPRVPFVEV